jgi:hypothetical protein
MKLFRRNDHNFLAAMHGDMLNPFTANTPHQPAKTRPGIRNRPVTQVLAEDELSISLY